MKRAHPKRPSGVNWREVAEEEYRASNGLNAERCEMVIEHLGTPYGQREGEDMIQPFHPRHFYLRKKES